MHRYDTNEKITALVRAFEECTIARDDWKHAEHLVVALYYVSNNDLETATDKMRSGIFKLLLSFGVNLTKEMPYHETLTVFWMRTVYAYSLIKGETTLAEKAAGLTDEFNKDYPLRFYSRDELFSNEARSEYLTSDRVLGRANYSA